MLDTNKNGGRRSGATYQGSYRPATRWVYNSPIYIYIDNTVLFYYQSTRSSSGPERILSGRGYLQTDGYRVYKKIGASPEITHLAWLAHARREFEKALDNDKARATIALIFIRKLYAVEAQVGTFVLQTYFRYRK